MKNEVIDTYPIQGNNQNYVASNLTPSQLALSLLSACSQ
jgi:hypothetical protein